MLLLCIAKKINWVLKNDLNHVTGLSWSIIGSPVYLYRQYFTARAIRLEIVRPVFMTTSDCSVYSVNGDIIEALNKTTVHSVFLAAFT